MKTFTGIETSNYDALPYLRHFIATLSRDFDVDFRKQPRAGESQYAVCLVRPRREIEIMFEIEQPILSLYFVDSYMNMELGNIIASEYEFHKRRAPDLHPRYIFICSQEGNAEEAAEMLAMFNDNSFTYVPFSISKSISSITDNKTNLFNKVGIKDYFDFSDPIQSDSLFFGRQRLLTSASAAVRGGQNLGIFGLRRVGKTSILFSLERSFRQRNLGRVHIFSLDDPSRVQARWTGMLSQLASLIEPNAIRDKFDANNAAVLFKITVQRFLKNHPNQNLVIAFDEIEHIVPTTVRDSYSHWKEDYFHLMDNIRAVTREIKNFSVIICGINAQALEQSHFDGVPNPIFNGMSVQNVQMFAYEDMAQMLVRLGLFMGISFDDGGLRAIHTEYGGHPLLIRQFCSKLFKRLQDRNVKWPFKVDKAEIITNIRECRPELHYWANYIFITLKEFYPDEFEMLKVLAGGDLDFYTALEDDKPEYSSHLRGYGLVVDRPPKLSMPFLKHYLLTSDKSGGRAAAEALDNEEDAEILYPFALIAALDDELDALLKQLRRGKVRQLPVTSEMPYVVYSCEMSISQKKVPVLVASTGKMGPASVQNLTFHLAHHHKISNFILVGICAGVRGKVELGDIVVADQVYDYSHAKLTNAGTEARPAVFPMSPYLANAAKRIKSFRWPKSYGDIAKKVRSGSVASGPFVFADDSSLSQLAKGWPISAAEMEASGASHALHSLGRLSDFIVVKSVTDYGDSSKNDTLRAQCCEAAATFSLQLVKSIISGGR